MAGASPSIESTSGFSICSRNCRAYADNDSTYRRWPSAKIVSNASEDLPEPETPVITTNLFRGTTTSMFLRLCSRAPRMTMESIFSCGADSNEGRLGSVPVLHAGDKPLAIRRREIVHADHHKLRYLVWMH